MVDAAVADTHALIFHAGGSAALGSKARAHFAASEAQRAITYIPVVVMWECALLSRAVRINFRRPLRQFFDDLFSNPAYQPLDLTAAQVLLADELRFTKDPVDALIVAAARDLGLPLITRDQTIRDAGVVKTIW
ncbi:MAG TPA: type II toxin-antitoxin system VapC family toxin [Vicinamibacterales bacterium]|nr:type II toxin-antitoxin system VapC family toxin [Vicinamibacterales bacterium]